jgi:hypothetical protein
VEIIEITSSVSNNNFSVRKFIKSGESHYVEIQPGQKAYRIRITSSDYHKGLRAYYSSRTISCYPIDGVLTDGTFEEVEYQMNID